MTDAGLVVTACAMDEDQNVLTLDPAEGGAIRSWYRAGKPVLRQPTMAALAAREARGLASYPLVPYSNRIAHGRFTFDGTDYEIEMDPRDRPHAIHGVGWASAWQVAASRPGAATLRLEHAGDARWPFPFTAEQIFALAPDRLTVTIAITNRADRPAPAGIGLHPFFPQAPGTRLAFTAASVWEAAPDLLPSHRIPVADGWDHSSARLVGSAAFDNCFNGWAGRARINHADHRSITISADALFEHLIVYVPPGQDFFAVEPVSNMNDGLNHIDQFDHGMRVLQPGETLAGTVLFDLGGW